MFLSHLSSLFRDNATDCCDYLSDQRMFHIFIVLILFAVNKNFIS